MDWLSYHKGGFVIKSSLLFHSPLPSYPGMKQQEGPCHVPITLHWFSKSAELQEIFFSFKVDMLCGFLLQQNKVDLDSSAVHAASVRETSRSFMLHPNSRISRIFQLLFPKKAFLEPRRPLNFHFRSTTGTQNNLVDCVRFSRKPNIQICFNSTYSIILQHEDCVLGKTNKCYLQSHN